MPTCLNQNHQHVFNKVVNMFLKTWPIYFPKKYTNMMKKKLTCIKKLPFFQKSCQHVFNKVSNMWLLPQKRSLALRTLFHSRRFLMFDRLVLAFYLADSTENCGEFLSYNQELKSKVCDFFAICSMSLPGDYYKL